jgi:hypothetical protein
MMDILAFSGQQTSHGLRKGDELHIIKQVDYSLISRCTNFFSRDMFILKLKEQLQKTGL